MELLKMFFKDEVPAIGLCRLKIKKAKNNTYTGQKLNFSRPVFKPNYSNNFFLL
jgi:hypothetical protein